MTSQQAETSDCDKEPIYQAITQLLEHYGKNVYAATNSDSMSKDTVQSCIELFKRDYDIHLIDNTDGQYCSHYPAQIVVIEGDKAPETDTDAFEELIHKNEAILPPLIKNSVLARCRSRFVVPVMRVKDKNICRSSTLSGYLELTGKITYQKSQEILKRVWTIIDGQYVPKEEEKTAELTETEKMFIDMNCGFSMLDRQFDEVRASDISLLEHLEVKSIFDLMVEDKKEKFGMNVSSSEKIDRKERYKDFNIIRAPYPGCEFFVTFKNNCHRAENIHYDWKNPINNVDLKIVDNSKTTDVGINWDEYKSWDLSEITLNYMKYLLKYIDGSDGGVLIHCISGWDRTPLFVSMVRLCLWADGLIHQSLNVYEIVYLTIAYDWFCFGHQLPTRLTKDEDIFYFCFAMMKKLANKEFSLLPRQETEQDSSTSDDKGKAGKGEKTKSSRSRAISESSSMDVTEDDKENTDFVNLSLSNTSKNAPFKAPMKRVADDASSAKTIVTKRRSIQDDGFMVVDSEGNAIPEEEMKEGKKKSPASSTSMDPLERRYNQLNTVAAIFLKAYFQTIGRENIKYVEGTKDNSLKGYISYWLTGFK